MSLDDVSGCDSDPTVQISADLFKVARDAHQLQRSTTQPLEQRVFAPNYRLNFTIRG